MYYKSLENFLELLKLETHAFDFQCYKSQINFMYVGSLS